MSPLFIQ